MDTVKQHVKHPKASMALGCCTLCWGILAAFFIFSGGIAVTNLAVEDAYFSAPQKCSTPANPTHSLSQRCNVWPGSIKKARSFNTLEMFISTADNYARLQRNESTSWSVGYTYTSIFQRVFIYRHSFFYGSYILKAFRIPPGLAWSQTQCQRTPEVALRFGSGKPSALLGQGRCGERTRIAVGGDRSFCTCCNYFGRRCLSMLL